MAGNEDNLKEYRERRDFGKTNEPAPETPKILAERAKSARFVIQQHDATRMHYDVRLEVDGVLKSWAVPEGPSTDPTVKRLAIMTEDHPMEYLEFEGVIPAGEYGAGPMIVWDQGTYENIRSEKRKPYTMPEALDEGLVEIRMYGKKIRGEYALVRTKFKDAKNSWLMVKMKDREADPDFDLVGENPESIKSGLTIKQLEETGGQTSHDVLKALPGEAYEKLREADFPGWKDPMLATASPKPYSRENWVYENKLDGIRCLIYRKGNQVQLLSRNQNIVTDQYPELLPALKGLVKGDCLLDGEIVALEGNRPSFEHLQSRMNVLRPNVKLVEEVPVLLYLFDVLHFGGYDTTRLNLLERKLLLKEAVRFDDPLRYTEHQSGDGVKLFKQSCAAGHEGLLAKDASSTYTHGRSKSWLKFKCVREQDLVVGGFTDPNAGMRGFGALVVGYYTIGDDRLQLACKVGTGFSDTLIRDLYKELKELETDKNPFAPDPELPKNGVHWVEPKLVAKVGYSEWTSLGHVRHPRFLGLRNDKDAIEVVRESISNVETFPEHQDDEEAVTQPSSEGPQMGSKKEPIRVVGGHKIKLTNLDKVLYPEDGITKGQVIDYYEQVAPYMIPQIKDRPLSLERFPDGIKFKGFYHKEAPEYFPDYIDLVKVRTDEVNTQMQVMANNTATLVYLAQMATITSHHWMSRASDLDKPDKIVFDLDPSDDESWDVVKEGARDLRNMLKDMGLPSYPLLTGSRGLHIGVPLKPEHDYEVVTLFSKAVCQALEKRDEKFTTQIRKNKRKGRVFLDYLRNRYAQTAVSPYSLRAKPGASIATPIDWDELSDSKLKSDHYTILNIFKRLGQKEDPWKDFFKHKTSLPDIEKIENVLKE